jgi:hypothetical protein
MRTKEIVCLARIFSRCTLFISLFLITGLSAGSYAQAQTPVASENADPAQSSVADITMKASNGAAAIPPKPRLQSPIHVVPFREPGLAIPKLNFFPVGSHVDYFGGPVISNVHIVEVLYGAGAYLPNIAGTATPTMANFFTDITQSTFFDMLSEYSTTGVTAFDGTAGTNQFIGHGLYDGQIAITPAAANNGPTITDNQIQAELLNQVTVGNLPAPVIDAQGNNNTLYMIFFPPGKTINDGTSNSCVKGGFCAYHNSTNSAFGTHRLFYGVMPDLQPPSGCSTGCGSGTTFDQATNVTSHELSEAVTDADVGPATTFARPLAWIDQTNGEIGDICVAVEAAVVVNGTAYTVQQEFSNLQNNCVAAPPAFQITAGPNVSGGQSFDLDLRIVDSNSGVIIPYTGIVHFTSSDSAAVLPADYTFTLADSGFHHFVTTLNTSGAQTVTVTDTKLPGFTGSSTLQVNVPNVAALRIIAPGTATTGTPVNFSITALDATNTPVTNYNGTVHFASSDAAAVLPANSPMVNGAGSFTATFNTAGFLTFQANDVANTAISGASFVTATAPSAHPTTTTLTGGPTGPIIFGQQATYLMTVTGNAGNVTGSMNATLDGASFVSGGIFNSTTVSVNPPGGTHIIYANYTGDGTNAPSSSSPVTVVVNPAPATMTVSSSAASAPQGVRVTFTATPSPFVLAKGSVTFFDGATPLGIIPISQAFNPGLTVTALAVGTHSITASFSGSPDLLAAVSAPIQQVITAPLIPDYSVSPDKTSSTILAGQAAVFNLTTQSLNGFTGTVSFTCGSLPALAKCTFSPSVTSVSGNSPTIITTLTVKTTGPHAALIGLKSKQSVYAMLWTFSPFTLGLVLFSVKKKKLGRGHFMTALLVLAMVAGMASCGGGGGSTTTTPAIPQVTPAGTTTITVSATGRATVGANPANQSQKLNVTLTVQP